MSNIEVPVEIQDIIRRVLSGKDFHMATTVDLAEFIHGLNKPEIEVENFVIYKVQVRGEEDPRMGFRVSKDVRFPWVTLNSFSPDKENAFPVTMDNLIHNPEEVTVIERWSPEAPEAEFGIGKQDDEVDKDREVLVKGVLCSEYVDGDGDVLVRLPFSHGLTESHYVSADTIAYAKENNGN